MPRLSHDMYNFPYCNSQPSVQQFHIMFDLYSVSYSETNISFIPIYVTKVSFASESVSLHTYEWKSNVFPLFLGYNIVSILCYFCRRFWFLHREDCKKELEMTMYMVTLQGALGIINYYIKDKHMPYRQKELHNMTTILYL